MARYRQLMGISEITIDQIFQHINIFIWHIYIYIRSKIYFKKLYKYYIWHILPARISKYSYCSPVFKTGHLPKQTIPNGTHGTLATEGRFLGKGSTCKMTRGPITGSEMKIWRKDQVVYYIGIHCIPYLWHTKKGVYIYICIRNSYICSKLKQTFMTVKCKWTKKHIYHTNIMINETQTSKVSGTCSMSTGLPRMDVLFCSHKANRLKFQVLINEYSCYIYVKKILPLNVPSSCTNILPIITRHYSQEHSHLLNRCWGVGEHPQLFINEKLTRTEGKRVICWDASPPKKNPSGPFWRL